MNCLGDHDRAGGSHGYARPPGNPGHDNFGYMSSVSKGYDRHFSDKETLSRQRSRSPSTMRRSSSPSLSPAHWVIGHLTDVDTIDFLRRCRAALAADGVVVIKDNFFYEVSSLRGPSLPADPRSLRTLDPC